MTRLSLLVTLLLFSNFSFGQIKNLNGILHQSGDTSFWYKYQNIVISDLSLTRLDSTSLPYYFRVWKANQVLDIWKTHDNSFFGLLTSWVTEQTPAKEKPTDRTLISKNFLQSDTVEQILNLINVSQIVNLPTDDSIKGWKHGFDGITYITEFSTKNDYSFKTYWTPKAQDTTLKEAKKVQSFVDRIFELSNSLTIWKMFEKTIPYECYNVGGSIACKVVTKKERRKFAKERKNYRQQAALRQRGATQSVGHHW
jgi:hypothetical protein